MSLTPFLSIFLPPTVSILIGALQWRRSLNNAIKGSAAFSTSSSSQQNLLIVPAGPLIVLLDAKEGYIIAHVELAGDIETTPAVQGQVCHIYIDTK